MSNGIRSDVVYELALGRLCGNREQARDLLAEVTESARAVLITGRDNLSCSENFLDEVIEHGVRERGLSIVFVNLPNEAARLARLRRVARKVENCVLVVGRAA